MKTLTSADIVAKTKGTSSELFEFFYHRIATALSGLSGDARSKFLEVLGNADYANAIKIRLKEDLLMGGGIENYALETGNIGMVSSANEVADSIYEILKEAFEDELAESKT